jgi:hypothetical protein
LRWEAEKVKGIESAEEAEAWPRLERMGFRREQFELGSRESQRHREHGGSGEERPYREAV